MTQKLINTILEHSIEKKDFNIAKQEWKLKAVTKGSDNCICGKALKNLFYIANKNSHNKKILIVGSDCIQKFLPIPIPDCVDDLQKLENRTADIPSKTVVQYAIDNHFIYVGEQKFLLGLLERKPKLSEKQASWLEKILQRIITHTTVIDTNPSMTKQEARTKVYLQVLSVYEGAPLSEAIMLKIGLELDAEILLGKYNWAFK